MLTANVMPTVCQFVAAGLGVSLVHPLFLAGLEASVVARPFEPATLFDFLLCYARDARHATLVADFVQETKAVAARHAAALARRPQAKCLSRSAASAMSASGPQ